jgi:hypothetical protein
MTARGAAASAPASTQAERTTSWPNRGKGSVDQYAGVGKFLAGARIYAQRSGRGGGGGSRVLAPTAAQTATYCAAMGMHLWATKNCLWAYPSLQYLICVQNWAKTVNPPEFYSFGMLKVLLELLLGSEFGLDIDYQKVLKYYHD